MVGEVGIARQEEESTATDVLTEQPEHLVTEQPECQKEMESSQYAECSHVNDDSSENDDSHSNMSLDMSFGSKLMEFKLSAEEEFGAAEPAVEPENAASEEFPHTCSTCKKTYRQAATLSRHQKIHLQENQLEDGDKKGRSEPAESNQLTSACTSPVNTVEQQMRTPEKEENSSVMETGAEDEGKECQREERSDEEEESGSSDLRCLEEENESPGGKTDKRKKICSVCTKRFWSLQDLTRHMRSHTGKSLYQPTVFDLLAVSLGTDG